MVLPTMPIIFPRCCPQRGKRFYFSSSVFFCVVAYNADNFSVLWTTAQKNDRCCCLHSGKIIGVVANNAEKCSNLNISMNSKPYAYLHYGFNQGPRLMCFMKKIWDEKSRRTVPLCLYCRVSAVVCPFCGSLSGLSSPLF